MRRVLALFFLLLPWAHAQPEEALTAYTAGQYETAARLGQADESAAGYALAARAVLAGGVLETDVEPSVALLRRAQMLRTGYGGRARDLALSVLDDEPDHAYAHGFLAVWNIEVLRRGGRLGALVMGASLEQGRYHYAKAIEVAPDDGALHWQWGRVLAATNPKKYQGEIDRALAASVASQRDDALEGVLQMRAVDLQDRLVGEKDLDAIKAYAASLL